MSDRVGLAQGGRRLQHVAPAHVREVVGELQPAREQTDTERQGRRVAGHVEQIEIANASSRNAGETIDVRTSVGSAANMRIACPGEGSAQVHRCLHFYAMPIFVSRLSDNTRRDNGNRLEQMIGVVAEVSELGRQAVPSLQKFGCV